jgi:hypothetical protein
MLATAISQQHPPQKKTAEPIPRQISRFTHVSDAAAISAVAALPFVMGGEVKTLPSPRATTREPIPAWAREQLASMTAKTWRKTTAELLA